MCMTLVTTKCTTYYGVLSEVKANIRTYSHENHFSIQSCLGDRVAIHHNEFVRLCPFPPACS